MKNQVQIAERVIEIKERIEIIEKFLENASSGNDMLYTQAEGDHHEKVLDELKTELKHLEWVIGDQVVNPKLKQESMSSYEKRQAAIKLEVPDSGEEWLDDMIRRSLRNKATLSAMNGMLAFEGWVVQEGPKEPRFIIPLAFAYAEEFILNESNWS